MPTVVLVGTLDTKGGEYAWLRERLRAAGCEVVLVDTGVLPGARTAADVTAAEVARAGGADLGALRAAADRGAAMVAMGEGAAGTVRRLYAGGRLDAVLAVGGSGGSSVAARAMRALPVGVPKLLVSTMASGDVAPYVGGVDVTLMYSVVDVAGINRVSARGLGNAVAAVTGMAAEHAARAARAPADGSRPLVAASMFGVTTPAVTAAARRLEGHGYDVLVFHATGAGGKALEALASDGDLAGVLDLTTTELADELVGGVLTAGPDRLTAAGRAGIPQVVSLGATDMVNFGAPPTVPPRFAGRRLLRHNPTVTLMRIMSGEMAEVARTVARRLGAAQGPAALYVPLRGVSAVDAEGEPFHDRAADDAAFAAAREEAASGGVEYHEVDAHINDERFAHLLADRLHELIA